MNRQRRLARSWRRFAMLVADFAADRRGTVAAFMAAAIIPLIGALGLATDAARGYMLKSQLSSALDAAALAGGKVMFSANRDADIGMYFGANFPANYMDSTVTGPTITVNADQTVLRLEAQATINTTFMRVLGFDTLTIAAATEVTRAIDMLDLVISIDVTGSMGSPMTKIEGARDAATNLVNILYGSNTTSPTYEVDGTTYYLLNIGVVPWNAKVNIAVTDPTTGLPVPYDASQTQVIGPGDPGYVSSFINPITGAPGVLYKVNNTPVPLLRAPPAGWKGGVYARYIGDDDNANDADLTIGQVTMNGKQWMGWDPIPPLEGESVGGRWGWSETYSRWDNANKSCYGAYWNDNLADPDHPDAVPNQPAWWRRAVPTISASNDCTDTLGYGITPLTHEKQPVLDAIAALTAPAGTTNIPQGLYWAWEVLMPSLPFTEAVETVPFPRQRAIVLLTDGEIVGGNGDAYGGRFGSGTGAGSTTNSAHGYMPSPPAAPNTYNNLNNRLLQLAANIKAQGVKLYVIQFDNISPALTTLLSTAATEPNAPYYFNAPTVDELKAAFDEIAANLSKLRLSM